MYRTSFFLSVFSYTFEVNDLAKSFAEIYIGFSFDSVFISDSVPALLLKTCISPFAMVDNRIKREIL